MIYNKLMKFSKFVTSQPYIFYCEANKKNKKKHRNKYQK